MTEIIIIALILLLFFGGKKIPELMRGLGRGVKEYKDASKEESEGKQEKKAPQQIAPKKKGTKSKDEETDSEN